MVPETGLEPVRFIKPRDFLTNHSFRCHLLNYLVFVVWTLSLPFT